MTHLSNIPDHVPGRMGVGSPDIVQSLVTLRHSLFVAISEAETSICLIPLGELGTLTQHEHSVIYAHTRHWHYM